MTQRLNKSMENLNDLFDKLDSASDKAPLSMNLDSITDALLPVIDAGKISDSDAVDIHKYLRRLDDVTVDVLAACKSDRAETQGLINILREQVEMSITSGTKLSTGIVESLVKEIEVKSNINTTAVKMIEANAKTLAATKSSINIQQNTVASAGFDSAALERLLSEPLGEEDEI